MNSGDSWPNQQLVMRDYGIPTCSISELACQEQTLNHLEGCFIDNVADEGVSRVCCDALHVPRYDVVQVGRLIPCSHVGVGSCVAQLLHLLICCVHG